MTMTSPFEIPDHHSSPTPHRSSRSAKLWLLTALLAFAIFGRSSSALAQVNGVGARPYQGWSTFSEQTISNNFMNEQAVLAQSEKGSRRVKLSPCCSTHKTQLRESSFHRRRHRLASISLLPGRFR